MALNLVKRVGMWKSIFFSQKFKPSAGREKFGKQFKISRAYLYFL